MPVLVTPSRRRAVTLSVTSLLVPLVTSPAGAACDLPNQTDRAAPEVTMTVLPNLEGSTDSDMPHVRDINNQGQIVGQGDLVVSPGEFASSVPTLWQDQKPMPLPTDHVGSVETAEHVNEHGQVLVNGQDMPYLWTDGEVTPLPVPNWEIVDLNDKGQVLVQLDIWNAALWEDGELTPIRPPGDDKVKIRVRDLSEAGHVVGGIYDSGAWNGAFIWQDGTFRQLSGGGEAWHVNRSGQVLSGGLFWDSDGTATRLGFEGTDLNDRGQIVGVRYVSGAERAVLWEKGQLTDLGTLGGENSSADEINELGQVVGISDTVDDPWHNFLWVDGQMIDIGEAAGDSGPQDINDHGQIIGHIGWIEGGARRGAAVLWEIQDAGADGSPGAACSSPAGAPRGILGAGGA